MNVFVFFVEPANYTIDLINNVHKKIGVNYCFMKSDSFSSYEKKNTDEIFLDQKSLFSRLLFVYNIWRNHKILIVNGYDNYIFIILNLFNIFFRRKKIIAIESDTMLSNVNNVFKRIIKIFYLKLFFSLSFVYGLSGGSKGHKDIFRFYGMSEDKIFLFPLVVDNNKFLIDKKKPSKIFTFLFVGRLIKRKNIEELIKKYNSYFANKLSLLKIVGSGPMFEYLYKKYSSEKVIFLNKMTGKKLVNEYHQADVFLCPSYFEPWGLVVNEALSASLPVIVRKEVGSSEDLVKNKNNGFVVNSDSEMLNKMIELYNNPNLVKLFSKNSSDFMKEVWNYELYLKCFSDFLRFIKNKR